MWQSPWDNAVAGGDQVAQAIWAIATGGPFGTGLGLGDARYLPAGHTDLVLAAVGEELGAVGLIVVTFAYAVVAWRGFRVSHSASNDYGFFLATALTLFLIVPVLVMAAGVMGITPLTGVVTPFLSYGGSAMAANCAALGMLCSIHADRRPAADLTPFRAPIRWLVTALAASADGAGRRADRHPGRACRRIRREAAPRRASRRRTPVRLQPAGPRSRAAASSRDGVRPKRTSAGDRGAGGHRTPRVRRISGSASRSTARVQVLLNVAIRWAAAPFTCSGMSGRA